jgi:hypothetical protein
MSEKTLQLKNLSLDNPDVRIKTIAEDSSLTDSQVFKSVTDGSPCEPAEYRIKAVDNDGNSSIWTEKHSVTTTNINDGFNEFRVRAVTEFGLRSDWISDVIYINKETGEVVSRLLLQYCFDILENYMNDYISDVFLSKEIEELFDVEEVIKTIEDLGYAFIRDEKDDITIAFSEFIDHTFETLAQETDAFNLKPIESAFGMLAYKLGPDYVVHNFQSIMDKSIEQAFLDSISEVIENSSENLNVILEDDESIDIAKTDSVSKIITDEIIGTYSEFKKSDVAYVTMLDMIDMLIKYFPEGVLELEFREDFQAKPTPNKSNKDELSLLMEESLTAYETITETFVDIESWELEDDPIFIWKTTLQDMTTMLIKEAFGIENTSFVLTDNNSVTPNHSANLILYDDREKHVCLSEEATKNFSDILVGKTSMGLEQRLRDSNTDLLLYDIVKYIKIQYLDDKLSLSFGDVIDSESTVYKNNLVDSLTTSIVEDSEYYVGYSANDDKVTLKPVEDTSYSRIGEAYVDTKSIKDMFKFPLGVYESIRFELGDFGFTETQIDTMGFSTMGYTPMGAS